MTFGDAYLTVPDLFPARLAGERSGTGELTLSLAGTEYTFGGLSPEEEHALRTRFGALLSRPSANAILATLFRGHEPDFVPLDLRGREYTIELSYEAEAVRIAGPFFMAQLRLDGALRGALWCLPGESFLGSFENFFRVLTAYSLLRGGGALFHSAAVVEEGEAFLFLGASGAGKSTLSAMSLASGRRVLSDELNALHRGSGGTCVTPLPFAGDFGRDLAADEAFPLRALCRLRKGSELSVEPLGRAEAVGLLLSCSPFVNVDPFRQAELLGVTERLARDVPGLVLTFALEHEPWGVLRAEVPC